MYILYNIVMKIITTTEARKKIGKIVDRVKYRGEVFGIGRRNSIDALIIKFPDTYNPELDEITNFAAYSGSIDFLKDEPDIYSVKDGKKIKHV